MYYLFLCYILIGFVMLYIMTLSNETNIREALEKESIKNGFSFEFEVSAFVLIAVISWPYIIYKVFVALTKGNAK